MIETTAWLGHVADELTEEQRNNFDALVQAHHDRIVTNRPDYGTDDYNSAEYFDDDNEAWVAALEIVTGEIDLEKIGRAYDDAKRAAKQAAIMAVLNGASEAETARATRFSRPAIRKALGK